MLAIKNAQIFNGKDDILQAKGLLVRDGVFQSIVQEDDIPQTYKIVDADGKIISPGFIDVHTHLGVSEEGVEREGADFNEISEATTPQVELGKDADFLILDGNPFDLNNNLSDVFINGVKVNGD